MSCSGEGTVAVQGAETCKHSSSAFWPRATLLCSAGGRLHAAQSRRRNALSATECSSGVLGGACAVPVRGGRRWGGALRGGRALLCCSSRQRHGEAFGRQRGKVLSPVRFAQREVVAVTQTVALRNKQPSKERQQCSTRGGEGRGGGEQDRSEALRKWQNTAPRCQARAQEFITSLVTPAFPRTPAQGWS